jgi:hypothetical protein
MRKPDRCHAWHECVALRCRALVRPVSDGDHRSSGEDRRRALAGNTDACLRGSRGHRPRLGGCEVDTDGASLRRRRRQRDECADCGDPGDTASDRGLCLGSDPLLPRRGPACGHRESAHCVRGEQLPSAVRRCGRARGHVAARWSRHLVATAIARSSCHSSTSSCSRSACLRHPHARSGRGTRSGCGAVHHRLGGSREAPPRASTGSSRAHLTCRLTHGLKQSSRGKEGHVR